MTQKIVCTECGYTAVVEPADEKTAAKYVREHGKERGHQLRLETLQDEGAKEEV